MKRLTVLILCIGVLGFSAFAEPDEEEARLRALERRANLSIGIFRKEFKTRSLSRKMNALMDLSRVHHDLVIDEFAKKGLGDRNETVRDAAAQLMGEMTYNAEKAGDYLKVALARNEDHPEVQRSVIRSIGMLGYKDALEELKEAASHLNEQKYQWVTVEVVVTFGVLKDERCLPFLLWMAEYGGKVLRWATGSVTYDTGASGDHDQRMAEKLWKQKYGHVKPKKPPAPLIRTYMDHLAKTVKILTGQEFKNATEFRIWLIEHAEEYGLDPRKLTKK